MKKIFVLFAILMLSAIRTNTVKAITFEEAFSQSKPIAVLIYADWADDYLETLKAFDEIEPQYSNKYNFVRLNIADKDTKVFNKTFHIYPGLPYVLLFKDRGRISRYLKKDCVLDSSCIGDKLHVFGN